MPSWLCLYLTPLAFACIVHRHSLLAPERRSYEKRCCSDHLLELRDPRLTLLHLIASTEAVQRLSLFVIAWQITATLHTIHSEVVRSIFGYVRCSNGMFNNLLLVAKSVRLDIDKLLYLCARFSINFKISFSCHLASFRYYVLNSCRRDSWLAAVIKRPRFYDMSVDLRSRWANSIISTFRTLMLEYRSDQHVLERTHLAISGHTWPAPFVLFISFPFHVL